MLESKMASQQRDVKHMLHILNGKECEQKHDDSQVFDKLPTSKIQITAYVEYFGQFTSEQFPEDIVELIRSCYPSKEQRFFDDVLATFVLHYPEHGHVVVLPIISGIIDGSSEAMMIVNALLEVVSHPEYDIASLTFNFWHSLQVIFTKRNSNISFGDEASIEAERNQRLQVFRQSYESLVSLVSFRVQYPQAYQDLSYEDLKEFKHSRYVVADVLTDAASVLGGDAMLQILYVKLLEVVSCCGNEQSEWHPTEAALFCIRAISSYVSVVEINVMPQVIDLFPKLPHQPQLLQTVCLIIGAFSKWLDVAPSGFSKLPLVIDILMSGMRTFDDSAAAVALAFRHICDDFRKKLSTYCKDLFHIYYTTVNGEGSFKGSVDDSLHLVEALSMVVTELPPEPAKAALEELCASVVTPLQAVINQGPEVLEKKHASELTVHIDRFAYIFRYVNHPEAVADSVYRLWPIFKAIFDICAWDMRTMESLCRACKYVVRTSGRFMGITIEAMLEEIQGMYQQHHQLCFLYLSSEVIKIFGSDPSCASYLKNMIEVLFKHITSILTSIKEFTTRPDIADDCFLLASRCIRYCPQLFVLSAVFLARALLGKGFDPWGQGSFHGWGIVMIMRDIKIGEDEGELGKLEIGLGISIKGRGIANSEVTPTTPARESNC
ncbi:ARM repeat superfamily protein isoform 2 [Hibiscus syriacus]|uniref:ARM repeat superfamily protein isoform 2 n=1 Tax=Hibiscus syriacus TaxID=106335 RepID=A0A6A2XZM8_HIBSY|nr:ARM repeat superfamily protein isoform 2 [Hibiscus syriacus]